MKQNEQSNVPAEIKNKAIDYVTSGAKAIVGAAPIIGSLLAELAGSIIPNQRIERISHFAALLESRITNIETNLLHDAFKDEEFTELLEEALHQAARATSEDRRKYLSSLVANSLTSEAIEHNESKHLLRILGELNDIEIIWLRFFLRTKIGGDVEFRKKHASIIEPRRAFIGCSTEELDKHALQESYRDHLLDLGLLDRHVSQDINTKQPVFDPFSGELKVSFYDTSPLGRLLLRTIGINDSQSEKKQNAEQSVAGYPPQGVGSPEP